MKDTLDIFALFIIPFGGGIPAGTVLAQSRGFSWQVITLIYLLSNTILIPIIEPAIHGIKKSRFFARIPAQFKSDFLKRMERVGLRPDLFSLVVFSFGSDLFTARVATLLAGYKLLSGWVVVMIGNMVFFMIVMASSLWFNNLLGNGTMAAVTAMIIFIGLPAIYRRVRSARSLEN